MDDKLGCMMNTILSQIWTILLGFLEGFVLILSPCILPVLPIVLATSLTGSKRRPLGITFGFVLCFTGVAFFSRHLVQILPIDFALVRWVAYGLLGGLGVIMMSPRLSHYWERGLSALQNSTRQLSMTRQDGFGSGLVLGALISLVWVPCAGPILAAVIVQTIAQTATWVSCLSLLAFAIGAALPMFWIAIYGKVLLNRFVWFKTKLPLIRQGLGLVLVLTVLGVVCSPYMSQRTIALSTKTANALQDGVLQPYSAPEIAGIHTWINAPEQSLSQLRGNVVLLDFWTYSCINCLRTIPHLNALYAQYHDKGLQIIGIHSPEFEFEKDPKQVSAAVKRYAIRYPIALDNAFVTWLAFHNHYWPAQYLLDQHGNVVYVHFGEGAEDILVNNIQYLLHVDQKATRLSSKKQRAIIHAITPETYLGFARSTPGLRPQAYAPNQTKTYTYPHLLAKNAWVLQGQWHVLSDHILSRAPGAAVQIHFSARSVYLVMGSETRSPLSVLLRFRHTRSGPLVWQKSLRVQDHRLYRSVELTQIQDGYLEIQAQSPGLALYTITFGG